MTITLTLLFLTLAASTVLSTTADAMREKIDITIYFKPETEEQALKSMADTMRKDDNVKSVEISTSEEEFQKFIDENKDNQAIIDTVSDEDMKKVMLSEMPSTMRVKVYDANDLTSIKNIVNKNKEFEKNLSDKKGKEPTYDTNDAAIDTIASWSNIAKNGGLTLCAIFLFVSILVILNTIRMAIYSRSEEIYMEKLIGADGSFIRGPFLVEAMISGFFAGIFAGGVGLILINVLAPKLQSYDIDVSNVMDVITSYRVVYIFLGLSAVGMIIAYISSRLAIRKYLRKI
jgi:cell division transport system permease protein